MGKPKKKEKDGRQNFNPSKSSTNPGMCINAGGRYDFGGG